jgi:AraC-like DNA-binding protein
MTSDRLGTVFERFRVQAVTFHAGPLCGLSHHDATRGLGFIHVLRKGSMEVLHEREGEPVQRVMLDEPTLIFYPRPWSHAFVSPPHSESELVCATLRFDGGAEHPIARALPPVVIVPLRSLSAIEHTLALLFAEAENARNGERLLANRLFEVLLIQLLRWLLERPALYPLPPGLFAGLSHPQLAQALVAMNEKPAEAWSIERLAECAGLSRSRFAELFRDVVGETPVEHLVQWRIALAKRGLSRGDPIKRIAAEVGYGSASALSRAFSSRTGLSPSEWHATQVAAQAQRAAARAAKLG